jgi:hypothetical protein
MKLAEARDLLGTAYARFTEGFDTYDLKLAKQLLDELTDGSAAQAPGSVLKTLARGVF